MEKVEFVVDVQVHAEEYVAVCGNIKQLGKWKAEDCLELTSSDGVKWSGDIYCPKETNVEYVYFIGLRNQSTQRIINRFECGLHRKVLISKSTVLNDKFGEIIRNNAVDKGWLTAQTEVRITFSCRNEEKPLQLYSNDVDGDLTISCIPDNAMSHYCTIIKQFAFENKECGDKVTLPHDCTTALSYCFQSLTLPRFSVKFNVCLNERTVGDIFLCNSMLDKSHGHLYLPVINDSVIVGHINLSFVVIKPFKLQNYLSFEQNDSRTWGFSTPIEAGHRGSGNSFTSKEISDLPENTVASFNAASKGVAKMVEFDVHLSKDFIPVVYHDLTSAISVNSLDYSLNLMQVYVKDLTLSELQNNKMFHKSRISSDRPLAYDTSNDNEDHKLFPTLKQVLSNVSQNLAFNIECKWPTFDCEHEWEDGVENYFDANRFVDEILGVVFSNAGKRIIHFSCFDADICILLRRKQNRYPVNLLTNGDTKHYTEIMDVRVRCNSLAVGTALSEGFMALNTLENDVYANPDIVDKVHSCGLKFCLYGDNIREDTNREKLKSLGVDVLIYDRIHTVSN